jgi:hypothetical protein
LHEIGFDNLGAGWIRFFRLEIISFDTFGVIVLGMTVSQRGQASRTMFEFMWDEERGL